MSFFDERYAQEVRHPKPKPKPIPPPKGRSVGDVVNFLFTVGTKAADFFVRRLYR